MKAEHTSVFRPFGVLCKEKEWSCPEWCKKYLELREFFIRKNITFVYFCRDIFRDDI